MIKGILFDLSGVLYIDGKPIVGAIDAIKQLKRVAIPYCFITNTTRRTKSDIQQALSEMGFNISADTLFTASSATLSYLADKQLRPHLLIHSNLLPEFSDLDTSNPNAVVLGDAADEFTYSHLNKAFRVLMSASDIPLISMGYNRYFREAEGLSLDLGAFTAALEFASDKQAIVMGKPSKDFFLHAVNQLGCKATETLMIGDDVYSDIEGAMRAGLQGCLVKTGKYQSGDELKITPSPTFVAENITDAIEWALKNIH